MQKFDEKDCDNTLVTTFQPQTDDRWSNLLRGVAYYSLLVLACIVIASISFGCGAPPEQTDEYPTLAALCSD